jgi:hypothetical protein
MLSFYKQTIDYFKQELGFSPFRETPREISIQKVTASKDTKGDLGISFDTISSWQKNEGYSTLSLIIYPFRNLNMGHLERIFTAIEALLSYIPEVIRGNALMHAMVVYRLAYGKSTLVEFESKTAGALFEMLKIGYDAAIAGDIVMKSNLDALSQMLPSGKVEQLFKNYLHTFASYEQFLTNETPLLNAIIEDVVLKYALNATFNRFETFLLHHLNLCFTEKKQPVSPEEFIAYLRDRVLPDLFPSGEHYSECVKYLDPEQMKSMYKRFESMGVSFSYRIDYTSVGFNFAYYVIEFEPYINRKIIDQCFTHLFNVISTNYNYTSENVVQMGVLYRGQQNDDQFSKFFIFLQTRGIIRNYFMLPYGSLYNLYNLYDLEHYKEYHSLMLQSKKMYHYVIDYHYECKTVLNADAVDFILFRLLAYIGNNGFWLRYERGEIIKRFREGLESTQKMLFSEITTNEMLIHDLKTTDPILLQDITQLFSLVFPKWKQELMQTGINTTALEVINQVVTVYGLTSVIILLDALAKPLTTEKENDIRILLKLVNVESAGTEICKIIQNQKLQKRMRSAVDYLKSLTRVQNKIIAADIKKITEYTNLNDTLLEKEFTRRFGGYLALGIVTTLLHNSFFMPAMNLLKVGILRGIDKDDPRLQYLEGKLAHGFVVCTSSILNYTMFYSRIYPNMDVILHKIVTSLFGDELLFYGHMMGYYYAQASDMNMRYNTVTHRIMDTGKAMDEIANLFIAHKENQGYIIEQKKDTPLQPQLSEFGKEFNAELFDKKIMAWVKTHNGESFGKKVPAPSREVLIATLREFQLLCNNPAEIPEISALSRNIKHNAEPNQIKFGFTHYIMNIQLNKKSIQIEDGSEDGSEITAEEYMMVPGCCRIETLQEVYYTKKAFLHYIFPAGDYCYNLIAYGLRRKLIHSADVYALYQIKINFLTNYFLSDDGWNISYAAFGVLSKKIISEPDYRFTPKYYTIDFRDTSGFRLGKESREYETLIEAYQANLIQLGKLKQHQEKEKGGLRDAIKNKYIFILPEFDRKRLDFEHRITLILDEIEEIHYEKLLMIFSLLPHVIIYEASKINLETDQTMLKRSLIADIYVPSPELDKLNNCIQMVVDGLNITKFILYQQLTEQTAESFTNRKVRSLENPYSAHDWDEKARVWRRVQYFDESGRLKKRSNMKKGLIKESDGEG